MKTLVIFLFFYFSIFSQVNYQLPVKFPHQNDKNYYIVLPHPIVLNNSNLLLIFSSGNLFIDSLYCMTSNDGGLNWHSKSFITTINKTSKEDIVRLSAVVTNTGRIILVYSSITSNVMEQTKMTYSDDNGISWSMPTNFFSSIKIIYPFIFKTPNNTLYVLSYYQNIFFSTNNGNSWQIKNIGTPPQAISCIDDSNFLGFRIVTINYPNIYMQKSSDGGNTWSTSVQITNDNHEKDFLRVVRNSSGKLWLFYSVKKTTNFYNINQYDIYYIFSTDDGTNWTAPKQFTKFIGNDFDFNATIYNDKPFLAFNSTRFNGNNLIYLAKIETTEDLNPPPTLYQFVNSNIVVNQPIKIKAYVNDEESIQSVKLNLIKNGIPQNPIQMFDDGLHDDSLANDNLWGIAIGPFSFDDEIEFSFTVTDNNFNSSTFNGAKHYFYKKFKNKWLTAGSLHNWYSPIGSEYEEGELKVTQYGLRWPAIYPYQDNQVSKAMWIGTSNFTDENNNYFSYKVVHVGPSVNGQLSFFPKHLSLISKFEEPKVFVNGTISSQYTNEIDSINPSLISDRMIYNKVNSQTGITVERKIYQFSQQFHDNYIVDDYTFTNTGNTDADSVIELPNKTLDSVYFFFLYRYAMNRQTRYVIGNGSGWGMNSMIDGRGDGVLPDPQNENFRCQFSWHGYWPFRVVNYNNIGGPIWSAINSQGYVTPEDTVGRLGASQFSGVVTLYADKSATNKTDDITQPKTTQQYDSDINLFYNNNPYNISKMLQEYGLMKKGHISPRHAYQVHPSGDFENQVNPPEIGTSGGFSIANGYGPYTLGPNQSIRIVFAEAVNGISRDSCISMGKRYKNAYGTPSFVSIEQQKNKLVMTGKDSLMITFKRAVSNFNVNYNIPSPPMPPKEFRVDAKVNKITLAWNVFEPIDPKIKEFHIYRANTKYDSSYYLVHKASPNDRFYEDSNIVSGRKYFYYIVSVGDSVSNNGGGNTPLGRLQSSRYYTQTYDPVYVGTLKADDENIVNEFKLYQNYPNPFNPNTKIKYQIAKRSHVTLKVFDLLGREVAIRQLPDNELKEPGYYELEFDGSNLSSGVYFYQLRATPLGGQAGEFVSTKKFVLMK